MISALSDLIPAVAGTFLLRDDPYFVHLHRRLHSVSAAHQGGLQCLPSFMVLSGIDGILGLFRVLAYGGLRDQTSGIFLPFMLFVSSVIYLASCAVGCWAWKAMQSSRAGLLDDAADVEHGQYARTEDGAEAML